MGIGGPGMGMPSPDAGGMLSKMESRKKEAVSNLESQKKEGIKKTEKTIAERVKQYTNQQEGILKNIASIKKRIEQLPNHPQAAEAKKKLEKQLQQMRAALKHIEEALRLMALQKEQQKQQIIKNIGAQKKQIVSNIEQQKESMKQQISNRQEMMKKQMQAMQRKSPEGGKVKG